MTCNTWGTVSLIGAAFMAYVATIAPSVSDDVAWGSSIGLFVLGITFFVIRKVSPLIPKDESHHTNHS